VCRRLHTITLDVSTHSTHTPSTCVSINMSTHNHTLCLHCRLSIHVATVVCIYTGLQYFHCRVYIYSLQYLQCRVHTHVITHSISPLQYINVCIHKYIYTYIHIHIYIHTQSPALYLCPHCRAWIHNERYGVATVLDSQIIGLFCKRPL